MSFFSSTTGVVTPALFPLIPGLASSTGIAAPVLFACTVLGAQSSAISPFSSGGSLILGSSPKEEDRNELFNRLLLIAVPTSVICCALFNFVVAFIFKRRTSKRTLRFINRKALFSYIIYWT